MRDPVDHQDFLSLILPELSIGSHDIGLQRQMRADNAPRDEYGPLSSDIGKSRPLAAKNAGNYLMVRIDRRNSINPMLDQLIHLARLSLRDPKYGAVKVLNNQVPLQASIELGALVVILGSILSSLFYQLTPASEQAEQLNLFRYPLIFTAIQGSVLCVIVLATYLIGQMVGGKGQLKETLILMVWLQFIMLLYQLVQFFASMLVPVLDGLLTIISIVLFFWLFANFVAVLHGFKSAFKVLIGTMMSMAAIIMGVLTLYAALGTV